MTFVKICGLRTIEHARVAVAAGADLLGFMFAPSRRQVDPQTVAAIVSDLRAGAAGDRRGRPVHVAGVFVNETASRMLALAHLCGLDLLQLSGTEPVDVLDELPLRMRVFKAIRLDGSAAEAGWIEASRHGRVQLLVDAHVPGAYGGTGVVADWARAAVLAREHAIILAGGLTPENVAGAIAQVAPWGVDVSSGVESAGSKDCHKIRVFVEAVRSTDRVREAQAT